MKNECEHQHLSTHKEVTQHKFMFKNCLRLRKSIKEITCSCYWSTLLKPLRDRYISSEWARPLPKLCKSIKNQRIMENKHYKNSWCCFIQNIPSLRLSSLLLFESIRFLYSSWSFHRPQINRQILIAVLYKRRVHISWYHFYLIKL